VDMLDIPELTINPTARANAKTYCIIFCTFISPTTGNVK
jgi:hypothetical protein